MELINATKMHAGYTMGTRPDGRELLVVVVKGTFMIPASEDLDPVLADEQLPLIDADEFSGEPGFSAVVYETDYSPIKPRCDVLLNGSAYAPGGKETTQVNVGLKVGPVEKSFNVVGNRNWEQGVLGPTPTSPVPFTQLPISYDNAFGGIDDTIEDEEIHPAYVPNPFGAGFHNRPSHGSIIGRPLPNTEESGNPVTKPQGNYRPMALGPIARSWQPRLGHAGTYDDDWQENVFPFLPADFDERYYQCAPEDQQMEYPQGGEVVELTNLTEAGVTKFRLPSVDLPIEVHRKGDGLIQLDAPIDTLVIEPDEGRFMLTWRASLELKKNMLEVPSGVVGRMPRGWYRARETGKSYYRSIKEFIDMQNA